MCFAIAPRDFGKLLDVNMSQVTAKSERNQRAREGLELAQLKL